MSIMNAIMPSAMVVHYETQAALGTESDATEGSNKSMAGTSRRTAEKGAEVLREVRRVHEQQAAVQIDALVRVCGAEPLEGGEEEGGGEKKVEKEWKDFCRKWGYGKEQLAAIRSLLVDL